MWTLWPKIWDWWAKFWDFAPDFLSLGGRKFVTFCVLLPGNVGRVHGDFLKTSKGTRKRCAAGGSPLAAGLDLTGHQNKQKSPNPTGWDFLPKFKTQKMAIFRTFLVPFFKIFGTSKIFCPAQPGFARLRNFMPLPYFHTSAEVSGIPRGFLPTNESYVKC